MTPNNSPGNVGDPVSNDSGFVDPTKKERYYQAVREHESLGADLNAQLKFRQQNAEEVRQRHFAHLDTRQNEYEDDRTQTKKELDEAKLDLKAAHRSASEHCSEIGVKYEPGKTTEADVLRVPFLEDAEAARRLNLPFGVGFNDRFVMFLKPLLTLLCWLMSSLSLGLGFRLLNAKDLFADPAKVVLSLVMGGVVAIGLLVALTSMWKPVGTKMGSSRPAKEVTGLLTPVLIITIALLLGLAFLDAKAMILLNAARAALNPAFDIPMTIALLIGGVISGVYVIGLAGTAFASGYNAAARESINALIKGDENDKLESAKRKVPIREALEALADVKVAEEVIQTLERSLERLDKEIKRERDEVMASIPQVPTTLAPEEVQELTDLRDRARSAKAHLDAHVMSRGGSMAGLNNVGGNGTNHTHSN